jgi:hypothetical protein
MGDIRLNQVAYHKILYSRSSNELRGAPEV